MPRFKRLVDDGLIEHVGVSNHSLAQWRACEDALGGRVLSNQVRFSLVHRDPERELVPWAQRNGRVVIAYSPLGQRLQPAIAALGEIATRRDATMAQVAADLELDSRDIAQLDSLSA